LKWLLGLDIVLLEMVRRFLVDRMCSRGIEMRVVLVRGIIGIIENKTVSMNNKV